MSKLGTTTLLLAVAISASDAQACGEVMYRMGGALRYHAFITHHPAQILIYNGDAARQAQGANGQFNANLERAGHKVTVVDSPDALATALAEGRKVLTPTESKALLAAFRIPNFLQNLFGEGVLSASFIPVYAGLLAKKDRDEADRVAAAAGLYEGVGELEVFPEPRALRVEAHLRHAG